MRSSLLVLITAITLEVGELPGQGFTGTVQIERRPADPGTFVQIVVYRADRSFTVCADTTVANGSYSARLFAKPECSAPGDVYEFYVNGVWAARTANPFSPPKAAAHQNLSVPMLALRTPDRPGVRLVWFFGTVTDRYGRPAPAGTKVEVEAQGGQAGRARCLGSGTTQDLFWTPHAAPGRPLNVKAFYWIGVEMAPECEDRNLVFLVSSPALTPDTARLRSQTVPVRTPPYGMAVHQNLVIDLSP